MWRFSVSSRERGWRREDIHVCELCFYLALFLSTLQRLWGVIIRLKGGKHHFLFLVYKQTNNLMETNQ